MEHSKDVEKMISKVMSKKELPRAAAIGYMLGVATGRLAALWRYEESVPEGKQTKGILQLAGRKKRAPKTAKIVTLPLESAEKPAKKSPKKPAKKRPAKSKTSKRKAKPNPDQLEMSEETPTEH